MIRSPSLYRPACPLARATGILAGGASLLGCGLATRAALVEPAAARLAVRVDAVAVSR